MTFSMASQSVPLALIYQRLRDSALTQSARRCCRYCHCVVAQVMRIARATFGQEPMATDIQVIAEDLQWEAEINT